MFNSCEFIKLADDFSNLRTTKAIELDNLHTIDKNLKCSSSAVDTVDIIHHVKLIWRQLEWPDDNTAIVYILKIVKV
jgi:hypothetical protein